MNLLCLFTDILISHPQSAIQSTTRELHMSLGADAQRPSLRSDEITSSFKMPENFENSEAQQVNINVQS